MATAAELQIVIRGDAAQADRVLKSFERSLGDVQKTAKSAGPSLGALGAAFAAGGVAAGLIDKAMGGVADGLGAIGKAAIGTNMSLERNRIAFTQMLGSARQADDFLRDMADFARTTPFSFEDATAGAKRLMAMGFAASEVKPLLEAVSATAAGMGVGAEGIDRLTLALGQMNAKGRVSQEELNQLSESGVNIGQVFTIMAEQTGKTVPELQALQQAGGLAADEFIRAFQAFAKNNFGDVAASSRTLEGAISNLGDAFNMAVAEDAKPFYDVLRDIALALSDVTGTKDFRDAVRDISVAMGELVKTLRNEWTPALKEAFGPAGLAQLKDFAVEASATFIAIERFLTNPPKIQEGENWIAYIKRALDDAGQAADDFRKRYGIAQAAASALPAGGGDAAAALTAANKAQQALTNSAAKWNAEMTTSGEKIADLKSRLADISESQGKAIADAVRSIGRANEDLRKTLKDLDAAQRDAADSLAEATTANDKGFADRMKANQDALAKVRERQLTGFNTREEADAAQAERERLEREARGLQAQFTKRQEYADAYNTLLQQLGQDQTEAQRDTTMAAIKDLEKKERAEGDGYDQAFALERQRTVNQIAEAQIRKADAAAETAQRIGDIQRERDEAIAASNKRAAAIKKDLADEEAARLKIQTVLDTETGKVAELRRQYELLAEKERLAGLMGAVEMGNATGRGTGPAGPTEQYGPFGEVPGTYRNPIVPGGTIGPNTGGLNFSNSGTITIAAPLPGDTPPEWFQRWQSQILQEAAAHDRGAR